MEVTRNVVVSPYAMFMDAKFISASKTTILSVSDVRSTAIGLVDFGYTMILPGGAATEAEWRAQAVAPPVSSQDGEG